MDTKEKEQCLKLVLAQPQIARPVIKDALVSGSRVAWLLKAAEQLYDRQEYVSLLLESLRIDTEGFDEQAQGRNVDILLALRETADERIVARVTSFLQSRNEDIRMAALECLEEQASHSERAKECLLKALQDATDESDHRFLGTLKSIAARHQWISENQ